MPPDPAQGPGAAGVPDAPADRPAQGTHPDPVARARRVALTLALGLAAALACRALGTPLPWLIGPLLASAALSMTGVKLAASGRLRNFGLWMIGVALGLYFTPAVLALLWTLAPALLAGIAWALALGYGFYRFLRRFGGERDPATAFFAAAIGGASEMAVMAERHHGRVDRVAAAHSLRVLLVVVLIPFAYQAAGVQGLDATAPAVQELRWPGLALLLAASGAGIALLGWLGTPNPWVLGALLVTLSISGAGVELSALPPALSNAGQLFIGVALGTRFTPDFARAAPRWLGAVALGTLGMIAVSAGFAWLLAQTVGLHPATVLLGTSPGGIAEMCITAKVLQLGVPVVTAFHVTRYVAVLTLTAPLFRLERRRVV
ncbi:MAG: AbrB family transcriptional regulator [Rubrivivax sp.]|nr:AbrB family transcriptional regulator [Rubrivivax sp.]